MSFASSLVIEELSAPSGSQPRSVTLLGPSLPFWGAEWAGENKLVTTWYNGNGDEGTQQTLGPREMPSTWSGDWRRTMMSRAPTKVTDDGGTQSFVIAPLLLAEFLEDMIRGNARLRVTWRSDGDSPDSTGKIVREGRAATWKFRVTRVQDIEWEIRFDWVSRGTSVQPVVATRDDSFLAQIAAMNIATEALASGVNQASFVSKNLAVRSSASQLSLGQIESFANPPLKLVQSATQQLRGLVSKAKGVAQIANTLVNLPFAIANQGVDLARNTVAVAHQITDQLGRTPYEQMILGSKVSDLTRAASYYADSRENAFIVAREAAAMMSRVRARQGDVGLQGRSDRQSTTLRQGDVIAIVVTKSGDTPQRLSQRYYGSPDHGADILRANRLPLFQPTFPPGKILVIPQLQTAHQGT